MIGRSNSLTRLDFPPNDAGYSIPEYETSHGYVRVTVKNGSIQTWAVNRPVHAPVTRPFGGLIRGRTPELTMPRPNREMDPSNVLTWQRQYVFSN